MKKLLLIAILLSFSSPASSQTNATYKRCYELADDVTMLIVGGAPISLIQEAVEDNKDYFTDTLSANDIASILARAVYRNIGTRKTVGRSLDSLSVSVQNDFCLPDVIKLIFRE